MTNTFLKKQTKGKIMNNAQELKAHLQDSNKARMYEAKKKKVIKIIVMNGVVIEVKNLPFNYLYEIEEV
jgi:hypothetical protein